MDIPRREASSRECERSPTAEWIDDPLSGNDHKDTSV